MPEYLPFHEMHSIQEAQINLLFEGQFNQQAIEGARQSANEALSGSLPHTTDIRSAELQINMPNPGSPIPIRASHQNQLVGFQMSAVKRNSQPARVLRLTDNILSVGILDYESWEVTIQAVVNYLTPVLSFLPLLENPINAFGIRIIDRYTFNGRPGDARAEMLLVRGNPYVTPQAFNSGANWHCNSGWFDYRLEDRVLHNLNVSSNRVELSSIVTIDHNATIQLSARRQSLLALMEPIGGASGLEEVLNSLHDQNKTILREMLIPDMLEKIGLSL